MALQAEFEARFSAEYRKKISNPDTRQPSIQNETLIAQAVVDATADFPVMTQFLYDSSETSHVMIAVFLVELWLLRYGSMPAAAIEKKESLLQKRIDAFKLVSSRARVTPKSSSSYLHSTPSSAVRPEFDDEQFTDSTPRAPGREED